MKEEVRMRFAALLVLAACGGKDVDSDGDGYTDAEEEAAGTDPDDPTDHPGGSDEDDSGGNGDPESPVVESGDAWCYEHTTGDTYYQWVLTAKADDPQGTDTLSTFVSDGISVTSGGSEVASYALVCDPDGNCDGSWKQDTDGILCATANSYTIAITVLDEDDNTSEPYEMTGRQGSGPEG